MKKREWNGGIGVCAAMKAPVGLLSHKAVLRKQDGAALPRQTWVLRKPLQRLPISGATRLGLPNRRCENRIPWPVSLVNPYFAIFPQKGCARRSFGVFSIFCPKKAPCFGRKPTCFLLLFKGVLAIIITQDFVGRFSFLSTPCSWNCRRRQFKTVSPPESRRYSAVFQRLNS